MKKLLALVLFSFVLFSCGDDDESDENGIGTLSVSLGIDIKSNPIGGRNEEIIPLEDFVVVIQNEDGSTFQQFDRAGDLPPEIELPTGIYRVVAYSDNEAVAEFENPYYYGQSELFSIDKEELKVITVTCTLANMMVTVTYSENVINTFDSYSTTVQSDAGGQVVFNETETREAHFQVSPLSIEATLTYNKTDGSVLTKTFTASITDPQPKTHYDIQVDAVVQDGQIVINLILDETVEVIEILLSESNCSCPEGQGCVDLTSLGGDIRCVELCDINSCPEGISCIPTAEGQAVCLDLGTCESNFDCPDGYGCYFNKCFPNNGDIDVDNDGYFNTLIGGEDCDDLDDAINPAAVEICGNGIDEDCDGIDDICSPDSFEPNDSFATASNIDLCSQISISLNTTDDNDIFVFDAVEGVSLTISVSSVPDNIRITLQLYNSGLDFEDIVQGGVGEDISMIILPNYSGVYYLQVEDNFDNVSSELFNLEICDN